MTNEKKLENLYTVARHTMPERYADLVKKPEVFTSDFIAEIEPATAALAHLIIDARTAVAKAQTGNGLVKLVERIYKNAPEHYRGYFRTTDGQIAITDGYIMVRHPDSGSAVAPIRDAKEPRLEKCFPETVDGLREIELPSMTSIKAAIAAGKAEGKKKHEVKIDLGEALVVAEQLLAIMAAIPGEPKCYEVNKRRTILISAGEIDVILTQCIR
jgi:hypothetical protein